MDPDLENPSRIQDPNLKPLQPLYVDSWASLHINMIEKLTTKIKSFIKSFVIKTFPKFNLSKLKKSDGKLMAKIIYLNSFFSGYYGKLI